MTRTLPAFLALLAFASAGLCAPPAQTQLPTPAEYMNQPGNDPSPPGTLSWTVLAQVKTVQRADKSFGPQYPKDIKALDRQEVKLYGFMMPLDQSAKQKRFLLTPFPPHCSFCSSGGPESIVEVVADKPFEFTYEPILVSGQLSVLDDDVVYYRVTHAVPAKP